MAAIDFPDAPTPGQVFEKWTWTGNMWALTGGTSGGGGGGSDGYTYTQDTQPVATAHGQTWFDTTTGDSFVWITDADTSQWVQTGPGAGGGGGGGGSGFTFIQETKPTALAVGDTWFNTSTAAGGGVSYVAIEEAPGGEKIWVQFAPGSGAVNTGFWAAASGTVGQAVLASGISTISWVVPVLGNIVYEPPAIGTLAFVIPRTATYLVGFRLSTNIGSIDRARITVMTQYSADVAAVGGACSNTQVMRLTAGDKIQFQTYNAGAAGTVTFAHAEIRELGPYAEGLRI